MNGTAVGGVEVECEGLAGVADLADPIFGFFGYAVGALALVIGNVYVDTGELGLSGGQGHGDDILESAEIVGVLPY